MSFTALQYTFIKCILLIDTIKCYFYAVKVIKLCAMTLGDCLNVRILRIQHKTICDRNLLNEFLTGNVSTFLETKIGL